MWSDLRFAWRTLRRAPGFTLVAVLSLALGMGVNAAISSLMYQVALRSLPVRDPQALFCLASDEFSSGWTRADNGRSFFSYPMYQALRDRNQVFTGMLARAAFPVTLMVRGEAVRAAGETVSGNFFEVLELRPALGRLLLPGDDTVPGQDPVIVLGHAYWTSRFGANPKVLNTRILMNGHPVLVVGVAPPEFRSLVAGNDPDFFAPLSMVRLIAPDWQKDRRDEQPDAYWLNLFGRLKPGIGPRQAGAVLLPLFRSILQEELPQFDRLDAASRQKILAKTLTLAPAAQGINALSDRWATPLTVLLVMAGLVLLIACANVANLLVARAAARQRETAVRLAVGATRPQLVRQYFCESLILALAGGGLGLLASNWLTGALLGILPPDDTGGWLTASLDIRILGYGFVLALAVAAVFGLAPAVKAARPDVALVLRQQSSGMSASGSSARLRQALVVAQICLSLLLLVGAGLFTRSLVNLLRYDPGFRAGGVITFSLDPGLNGYGHTRSLTLFHQLQERLERLPGATAVASAELSPFGNMSWGNQASVPGAGNAGRVYSCNENAVSPSYLRTLSIPLLAGREFDSRDNARSSKVAILNETLARALFDTDRPVGRHIRMGPEDADVEVVGVVKNSKYANLEERPVRYVYVPYQQAGDDFTQQAVFFIRTDAAEPAVSSSVRALVKDLGPDVPVERLTSLKLMIDNSIRTDRLVAALAIAFAALASLLAAVGLYGTIAYAVTRRTREFGIRLALGAVRPDILRLVMGEVARLAAIGVAVGLPASYVLARIVESQLFGIRAHDPWVLAGAALLMAAVAGLAGLVPATRAMRVEPVVALRHE